MDTNMPSRPDLSNFDPFGSAYRSDPESFHGDLLAASPGFITVEGVRSAFAAQYAQVTAVLRNFKGFSSLKPKGLPGMERIDFFNGLPVMNYSDPPDHTRRRKVVNPAFTPKRTEALNEPAAKQIDEALEAAASRGRFDAVADLTKELSLQTLLDRFLKVDKADQHIFLSYFAATPLLDKMKPGDPKPKPFLDVWDQGAAWCRHQLQLAREGKCDNLISLIAASVDDGTIGEDEMMATMIVLLTGGVSTVAGAAGSSLLYLARNPDIAARIRNDPTLAANHLEEALRIDSPVPYVMRFGTDSSAIGDAVIPRGMPLYVMLSSANRDPDIFPDPGCFSIDRHNSKDHVAFGQGMHTCIGNAITRNIVPIVIRKTAARFTEITLAAEPDAVRYNSSNPRARHLERLVLEVA
jgi:cytochrome P450